MDEKMRRLGGAQRRNRRNIVVGFLLVAISVAGVWFTIDANNHTEEFLVAARPAASGSMITPDSFRVAQLNLAGSSRLYLRPGEIHSGSYLLNTVDTGQVIARASIASAIIDSRQPVIVSSSMPVPTGLKVGDFVDIWVADSLGVGKFAPSAKLVFDAEISDIVVPTGVMADQTPKVQLLVPVESVAPILDAIAVKSAISLVLKRNLGDD
jgi:hypothetical protein